MRLIFSLFSTPFFSFCCGALPCYKAGLVPNNIYYLFQIVKAYWVSSFLFLFLKGLNLGSFVGKVIQLQNIWSKIEIRIGYCKAKTSYFTG